jgi:hypothetical protein
VTITSLGDALSAVMVKILATSKHISMPEAMLTHLFSNPKAIQHVCEDFSHVLAGVRFGKLDNVKDKTQQRFTITKKMYSNCYECFMVGQAPGISHKAQLAIVSLMVSQILHSFSWTGSP